MPSVSHRLADACDIRRGEWARAALLFANLALLIAAYTTTKAVRDAVFLSHFGLVQLSYLMIVTALVAGFLVGIFTRFTARLRRDVAIGWTHSLIALTLVGLAIGLRSSSGWVAWTLYFWSSLFGLILVAQFWLLANDLFDAREAKRLFPAIAAGGILGGICGGAIPGWLARPLGSGNLLYLVAAELLAAAWLSRLAWQQRRTDLRLSPMPTSPRLTEGLATVHKNPYVRLIAGMMVCMTVCSTFVQWQVKGLAKIHFGGQRDELAAFFGLLAMGLNIASFTLQLIGTPRFLRRFGVGVGLRVLPSGFLVGSVGLLSTVLFPVLALPAAAAAMVCSDGLRFSVDKASTELLYLPLSRQVKGHAKPFIDTVVDRAAGATSGFLWIALTYLVHIDRPGRIAFASLVTFGVVLIWLSLIARAHAGYLDSYRAMLGLKARGWPVPASSLADVQPELVVETRRLRALATAMRDREPECRTPARQLLGVSLDQSLERMRDLLGRVCPPTEVASLLDALRHAPPSERAGALELLDSQLAGRGKAELLDALEQVAELRFCVAPILEQ